MKRNREDKTESAKVEAEKKIAGFWPSKWVRVSTELLAGLEEWSEPVRVMVVTDEDDVLEMVFQRVAP